jgi:cell division protein FtsW (lipid II flippase)
MRPTASLLSDPKWTAMGCAVAATGLGLVYMMAAGAPLRYLGINAGALVLGIGLAGLMTVMHRTARLKSGLSTLALGVLLVGSSLFGVTVNGATRWIVAGGFSLQPSLLFIPMMVVQFVRRRDALSTWGLALTGVAVALQPDRGMAGALVVGLMAVAVLRLERNVLIALAVAFAGFWVALCQIDVQPAMPFVDQIFFSSFEVHPLAGLAVCGGAALLLAPAFIPPAGDTDTVRARVVFGAIWLGVIIAAALGNYPTPVVGYGGSAIIGYVLSSVPLSTITANSVERQEVLPGKPRDDGDPLKEMRDPRALSPVRPF